MKNVQLQLMVSFFCFSLFAVQAGLGADPLWIQYDRAGTIAANRGNKSLARRYWSGAINEAERTLLSNPQAKLDRNTTLYLNSLISHTADMGQHSRNEAIESQKQIPPNPADPSYMRKAMGWCTASISQQSSALAEHRKVTALAARFLGRNSRTTLTCESADRLSMQSIESLKRERTRFEQIAKQLAAARNAH